MPDGLLRAGRVGAPHGLDGSFHVLQPAVDLLREGVSLRVAGADHFVNRRRGHDNGVILRLDGIVDRDGADALRGQELLVSRSVAAPLGEEEWWTEDLEGCAVVDGETPVGVVARLLAYPSCELLEVTRPGGQPLLVPLIGDAVRSVDVDAKRIDVDLGFLGES